MKLGFDISHWQELVDFKKAKANGIEYAFIKVGGAYTNSLGVYKDSYFEQNASNSFGVMPRGFYWYFVPQAGGEKQANYFKQFTAPYTHELPLVVDVEYKGYSSQSYNALQLRKFFDIIGYDAMIYTSQSKWNEVMGTYFYLAGLPKLWVAYYPYRAWTPTLLEDIKAWHPPIPEPWKKADYTYWQFTEWAPGLDYGVESHTVDLNYTNEIEVIEPEPGNYAKYLTNLSLRTRPVVGSSSYIQTLPQGTIVRYYEEYKENGNIWLLVKTTDNLAGWSAMVYNNNIYMELL